MDKYVNTKMNAETETEQTATENLSLPQEMERGLFFVMSHFKRVCLICISLRKKDNLKRHFITMHERYEKDFPAQSDYEKEG